MGIADYVRFLLSYRHKVYTLRKKYDRAREKADTQPLSRRAEALRVLDQVEPTLIMLEEQNVSGMDRGRFSHYVIAGIKNAETAMKTRKSNSGK